MPSLDPDECRALLHEADRAVLATVGADARPHAVPVTFALDTADDPPTIVTLVDGKPKSTRDLRRLRNVTENPRVAFLVDRYEDDWSRLWWVRVDATAEVVGIGERHRRAVELLRARYVQYAAVPLDGPAIVARPDRWAGWAAVPPSRTPRQAASGRGGSAPT